MSSGRKDRVLTSFLLVMEIGEGQHALPSTLLALQAQSLLWSSPQHGLHRWRYGGLRGLWDCSTSE